ncbi:NADPH-dependent methylglyoxal reductase GRE2 protein [Ceratobasidium sp. AG-Ba]|nr:NADPH-dependent methylglyoxal reductase GRE2 protein [Ceratobasidium sp. AG-Ba]
MSNPFYFSSSAATKVRVLLTGANGFIGVQITRTLLHRGYNVVGAIREESRATRLKELFPEAIADSSLTFGIVPDITKPGAFDSVLLSGHPFDAVIHAGSPLSFTKIKDVKAELYQPAIEGTTNILESIKHKAPSVKRVVITSSFTTVADRSKGFRPGYVYTDKDWNPISLEAGLGDVRLGYSASKTHAEKAAWKFVETQKPDFSLTTLCPPFVLGPAEQVTRTDQLNESIGQIYAAFEGKALVPMSGYVWVDVRDVALAHVLAIESTVAANQRYIVAAGNYSPQQILNYIWDKYPERAKAKGISRGSPQKLWPEGGVFGVDTSKSRRDLGLEYRPLEESMKDMFTRLQELEA